MKLNTVTMRQSLSCYRISTCLPCSHHLHSFQFILLSIFYIFFFVCEKVHGPFFNFVSLEAASTGEIFQKGLLVYFYASFFFFFQKLRTEDPSRKVSSFFASHYLNRFFGFHGRCQSCCLAHFTFSVELGACC